MIRASFVAVGIVAAALLSGCSAANDDGAAQSSQAYSQHDVHWVGKFQSRGGKTNTLTVFAVDDDYAYFALAGKDFFGKASMTPVVGRARFRFIDDAAEYENGTCKLDLDKFFDDKRIDPDLSADCGGAKWSDLVGFYNAISGNPLEGTFTKKGTAGGFWSHGTPDANAVLTPGTGDPKVVHVQLSAGDQSLEGDASLKLDDRGAHLELRKSHSCGVEIDYGADAVTVRQTGRCGWNELSSLLLGTFPAPTDAHF